MARPETLLSNPETVIEAVGEHEGLLIVKLDIAGPRKPERAVPAAIERFGRIEGLVNNAARLLRRFL
jgi:NAD(P)-dependent dehydrogenase (short-subunit alcohol dehydrogenase family)